MRWSKPTPGAEKPALRPVNFKNPDIHTRGPGGSRDATSNHIKHMLNWAIAFLVIALIAAVLGFGGIAGAAVGIAKIVFFVFIVLCVLAFAMGRRTPRV